MNDRIQFAPLSITGDFNKKKSYSAAPQADFSVGKFDEPQVGQAQGMSGADTASKAGMASGNPYAMAAGLGLQVLSSQQKAAQAQENLKYQNELHRKREVRDAIGNVIKVMQRRMV